jgi:hypothetical protein
LLFILELTDAGLLWVLANGYGVMHWERNPDALRPDQLLGQAEALNVSVEDLVSSNRTKKRGSGPTGKMKQLFEAASQLHAAGSKSLPLSSKLSSTNTPHSNNPCADHQFWLIGEALT